MFTFDAFAALMDLTTSLNINVAEILPALTQSQAQTLVESWANCYGSYEGQTFDESITGPSPFLWMLDTCLNSTCMEMDLTLTSEESNELIDS